MLEKSMLEKSQLAKQTACSRNHDKGPTSVGAAKREHGSIKAEFVSAYDSGLNRRAFLRQTGAAAVLLGLLGAKPSVGLAQESPDKVESDRALADFNAYSRAVVEAVQLQLFPDDGDGPSATQLNGFQYLSWALDDPENAADGDKAFILKGVGWLEEQSNATLGDSFIKLTPIQQDMVMKQISQTQAGENWLSLLLYYLLESLTLDPVYGGNPDGIGWKWLEHQPGFPRPVEGKTYLDFS
ncbi:twin-arginine translocation signal domain-containing protein [Shewanella canadensis]|uniref:Twin-arginine translocation signal domain-containing protein n=1 Tax=Shewanella canadensis TaxID=271096 RepID=A0A3S0LNV9_9GAMM|nr:gluconate 2-dehydrogenase subunit 3 family protein [Shewanella canadensis]RTR39892.1 twin-arginine translocation signal domain-containing protein [Shewanella canadensis]